ncbi:FAD-binding protein [Allobranchiibius sp. CTAmp26]|uniref:FAD-binding protein n=1 Tax=Allobranchiibius sp. CTAmp26 TaxID=2815214 RepID=UPI001AA0BA67|nr:FAD-binding protein [Allobranchiibius sp. CTAmp26]MBO1754685.1 FAD-binding protein [Allobranchiibius sp. CTAmp26]
MATTDAQLNTNWSGTIAYRAGRRVRPTSVEELRSVLREAPSVKVTGSGHSFNYVADSENGWQIDLSGLVEPPVVSADHSTVEVSGGTTYGALVPFLAQEGLALANLASLPHITVAGSVATGTHGSGARQPGLAASVQAVQLMTADGDLRWFDRSDPRFPALVVSLGALGVVTRLRLSIEPEFEVRQDTFVGLTWAQLTAELGTILESAYSVSVFGRWVGPGPDHIVLKSRTDQRSDAPVLPGAEWIADTKHPSWASGEPSEKVTEQGGAPGLWSDRLPHFRMGFTPSSGEEIQSEFFVPAAHGAAAAEALLQIGERIAPMIIVSEIRAVAADGQWLSPTYDRDSVVFHFTWRPDTAATSEAADLVQQALAPFDPRPHWGKLFTYAGRLDAAYPRLDDFEAVRRELDPSGAFLNDFLRRHVASD